MGERERRNDDIAHRLSLKVGEEKKGRETRGVAWISRILVAISLRKN